MQKVGDRFSRLEIFLPEMMQVGQTMAAAMRILGPKLSLSPAAAQVAKRGKWFWAP